MQIMWVLQGPSGGGKTTKANKIAAGFSRITICSTDDFFIGTDGVYRYDQSMINEAHLWNQRRVADALRCGNHVVVDNTNIFAYDARPYVILGVLCGCEIRFSRCEGQYANLHGVPSAVVDRMRSRMQPLSVEACLNAQKPIGFFKDEELRTECLRRGWEFVLPVKEESHE